ncbi:ABC transporter permease [Desulfogranum mediterraneum]|uniref:ABC transporter permease n=1 Tax=Desulfogranum mediterraneum TaxID=160661 RepID=UPI00048FBA1F|nr:ABC transporter permease [Desulfogranum mediterraneum]
MQWWCNISTLALATWREGMRHKALWAILALAVLLTLANYTITNMFSWDLGKVTVEFGLSAVAFSGLLIVFFLGLKIMADDLERSRIYLFLSRPVTIRQYLFGKFLGLALILLATTVVLGVSAAASMQMILIQYPAFVPPGFSWTIYMMALFLQWLSLLMVLALSFFWFSMASKSFVALVFTSLSYIVSQNVDTLRYVVERNSKAGILAGQETLIKIVSWIFPNLSLFDKKHEAAYGLEFPLGDFLLISGYGLAYIFLLLWIAALLFQRKELAK